MMKISRRQLLCGTAAATLLAAVAPAHADVDLAELLKPPALGDMALGADEGVLHGVLHDERSRSRSSSPS